MSGTFDPAQHAAIVSTDDADLAQRFGLTRFDPATGQWTAPGAPTERPGEGGYFATVEPEPVVEPEPEESASSAAGTVSSTSSGKTGTSDAAGRTASRRPARTTANR